MAVLLTAVLMSGCARNPLTDSVHPGMGAERKGAALSRVAASSLAAGDLATAAGLYREAHNKDPSNVEYLIGLGTTLARLGQFEEAPELTIHQLLQWIISLRAQLVANNLWLATSSQGPKGLLSRV